MWGSNAVLARALAGVLAMLAGLAMAAPAAQGATLAIDDIVVPEGTDAIGTATFTVTLSEAQVSDVQVNWQAGFGGGQRPASQPADFLPAQGVLVFAPGETSKTIAVSVVGDALDEYDETFVVSLTQPVGATLGDPSGRATIDDDDAPPTVSVADATVSGGREGSGADRLMVFSVSLSAPSGKTIEVPYETEPGTAIERLAGPPAQAGDFEPKSSVLTFLPNTVLLQVTVTIVGDEIDEDDEQFTLELGAPREPIGQVPSGEAPATIGDGVGTGSIIDDDGPLLSVSDVSAAEGALGASTPVTVRIALDKPSPQPVSTGVATTNGTASTPGDYAELPKDFRVVIPAGSTHADLIVHGRG